MYLFSVVLSILFLPVDALALPSAEEIRQQAIATRTIVGQEKIFARDYAGAMTMFKALQVEYPKSPAGYFGEMAIYEVRMLEHQDFHLEREFLDATRRGHDAVDAVMQRYHPTATELMFCGSLYGLEGFFRARKGEWWSAYATGTKSRQIFQHVQNVDPSYVDARFGLGMYLYWRSVFTKELRFLPFFPDQRKEGIALVQEVAQKGHLAREIARVNLGVIYVEERRYPEAIKEFRPFVDRFPKNIILRSLLGRVFMADKHYDDSIAEFQSALETDPTFHQAHYYIALNLILKNSPLLLGEARRELDAFARTKPNRLWQSYIHYWQARIAEREGNHEVAKAEYDHAISLNKKLKGVEFRIRGLGSGLR